MAETGPIQAGPIEAAAKREAAAAQPQVDIDSSEPNFSSIPEKELESYAKRIADPIGAAAIRDAAAAPPQVDIDSSEPDLSSIPEKDLESYAKRIYLKELRRQGIENDAMLKLRIKYADKIFGVITKWLLVVVFLILCSAISFPQRDGFLIAQKNISFHLPDAVLIAFITTTTINVIALFAIVANWLFPKNPRQTSSAKPPKE